MLYSENDRVHARPLLGNQLTRDGSSPDLIADARFSAINSFFYVGWQNRAWKKCSCKITRAVPGREILDGIG